MLEVFRKSPEQNLDDQVFQVLQVLWWGPKNYLERLGHGICRKESLLSNDIELLCCYNLLYFYLHLPICLPMSRWNSLQLPSLPHVKGNEAAMPLVASRLKDLQDVQITEKQHGRMAIQCTHLEQRTLGERRPLGPRRTSPEVILARSGPGLSIATWATNQALFVCPLQVSSDAANWSAFNLHRTWRSFFLLW